MLAASGAAPAIVPPVASTAMRGNAGADEGDAMFEVFMAAIVMACGRPAAKFGARTLDAAAARHGLSR
ncbi:hypothetical protein BVI2075_110059 [Burkholderia vietnamiensis]|nr:hypothetical protein BVI2075_110059 [Burkholderia vietnamiensis]